MNREELDTTRPTALAPPGSVIDWRLAVAVNAANQVDLWSELPATVDQIAEAKDLVPESIRSVAELLSVWGLVTLDESGVMSLGPRELSDDERLAVGNHGVWIHRWSSMIVPRMKDRAAPEPETLCRPGTRPGLQALAKASAKSIVPVVEKCLKAAPEARRVLDLGGGHGEYSLEFARRGLSVTMQDLPQVIELAQEDDRFADIDLFAASVFDDIAPGPFDLVLCSTMTNMFSVEQNQHILRDVRSVVADGGCVAINSYMRDRHATGAIFGVQMLVATESGDAHGSDDYLRWLDEAGFGHCAVEDVVDPPLTVVTGYVDRTTSTTSDGSGSAG